MESQAKRMRLFNINKQLHSDTDSDSDLETDEFEHHGYRNCDAQEILARLRAAIPQLPSRTARKHCIHAQEWVKQLLMPSDFGQKSLSNPESRAVMELLDNGFLQLLPKLLQAQHHQIVLGALEVVGAMALHSTETNRLVACCKPVAETLAGLLGCRSQSLMIATCHCLVDIMVAPAGCRALVKSGVIEGLMRLLCWITDQQALPKLSLQQGSSGSGIEPHIEANPDHFFLDKENDRMLSQELENLFVVVLQTTTEMLPYSSSAVPSDLLASTVSKLQLMWQRTKFRCGKWTEQRISDSAVLRQGTPDHRQVLASLVVWLAMKVECLSGQRCNLRFKHDNLQELLPSKFFLRHWEVAPFLLTEVGNTTDRQTHLSCLKDALCKKDSKDTVHALLLGLTACPPIPADVVDPCSIFEDLQRSLGEPLMYGQDVRLVKSDAHSQLEGSKSTVSVEHHYYAGDELNDHSINSAPVRVEDCLTALKLGYTVAVKGMEFRFPCIAATATSLATVFGQASVGANLYLTPINAQGLALHYDDHCVLVYQVHGHKHWSIYSPEHVLPRLYDNRYPVQQTLSPIAQFVVDEGDWLYIPRGFAHQAYTCSHCPVKTELAESEGTENEDFSLHLTFGVEVEPPFEWEGLIHIALHYFGQRKMCEMVSDSTPRLDALWIRKRVQLVVILLHIAAREVGKECPAYRKACLLSAKALDVNSWVLLSESHLSSDYGNILKDSSLQLSRETPLTPESFFGILLSIFSDHASFEIADRVMRTALAESTGDGLSWMSWLRHLPSSGEDPQTAVAYPPLLDVLTQFYQPSFQEGCGLGSLQRKFESMKEEFLGQALYPEARAAFELVLGKYRNSRKKLVNGLLALHADSV